MGNRLRIIKVGSADTHPLDLKLDYWSLYNFSAAAFLWFVIFLFPFIWMVQMSVVYARDNSGAQNLLKLSL